MSKMGVPASFACVLCTAFTISGAEVSVDWTVATGPVKPVNGVGQPPMLDVLGKAPLFRFLKKAGIPYSRLHDVGGWLGGGLYVDIPNLFPDFDADETDPKNYRFAFTDRLIENLEKNKVEPFFRLGVTIENFVEYGNGRFPAVNILPPKDPAKWARICEHVIRHYTEGWANGYRISSVRTSFSRPRGTAAGRLTSSPTTPIPIRRKRCVRCGSRTRISTNTASPATSASVFSTSGCRLSNTTTSVRPCRRAPSPQS